MAESSCGEHPETFTLEDQTCRLTNSNGHHATIKDQVRLGLGDSEQAIPIAFPGSDEDNLITMNIQRQEGPEILQYIVCTTENSGNKLRCGI